MNTTPEQRRDERVAELIAAGLVVTGWTPQADASDPHTVVAYRLDVLEPTNRSRSRLDAQEAATALEEAVELVDWTPAPVDADAAMEG